jgi:hypothetical protein
MNSFLADFVRRRDTVITDTKPGTPAPVMKAMSLPAPDNPIEHIAESKAPMKDVHKFFKGMIANYNEHPAALRNEIKRRFKEGPA